MRERIILDHADARTPRYTSYPTAPHFSSEVGAADAAAWLGAVPGDRPVSLYLHVPYCREMCWYCGCTTKATRRLAPVRAFAGTLAAEIDLVASKLPGRTPVGHVHWGGGSPTYLPPEDFAALMDRLRARFDVRGDAEIAVEVDPRQMTPDLADAFEAAGVTRASLGVQTFDADVQAAINRVQDFETVARSVALLRRAGVAGVNLDLVYGLPRQTAEGCRDTVRRALALAPDRLSVFGYAHVPHMKPHQRLIDEAELPDAAARLAQADAVGEELAAAGYAAVGLDHYAAPGDDLARAQAEGRLRRNFQGYTTDAADTLIGFGPSAIGWFAEGYVQNEPSTAAWERRVRAGELAVARGLRLTAEDRMRRDVIERLMCDLEADVAAVAARHRLPAPEADLGELAASGIVDVDGSRVRIDPAYRPLARCVAAAYDAYLGTTPARHSRAV